MGRSRRPRPVHLGQKLKAIRANLELSITGMAKALDYAHPAHVSGFENGKREPPLPILLKYARLAHITVESLIDDEMEI